MPKPYDATMKELAEVSPEGFLAAFDAPPTEPVRLLNADLSTVTAAADVVFGIGRQEKDAKLPREVVHIEAQAGPDTDKGRDILVYNTLLHRKYNAPVHSILLLLQPKARLSAVDGEIAYAPRPSKGKMNFSYEVAPLWERPAEEFLAGALGLVPLAPLCRLPPGPTDEERLAAVIRRTIERLEREAPPGHFEKLATAAFLLSGLRAKGDELFPLFGGIAVIRESSAYQMILDEGQLKFGRRWLFTLGEEHHGPPSEEVVKALNAIDDVERLERLVRRALAGASWSELLETQ